MLKYTVSSTSGYVYSLPYKVALLDLDSCLNNLMVSWNKYHLQDCDLCDYTIDISNSPVWDIASVTKCGNNIFRYLDLVEVYEEAPVELHAVEAVETILSLGWNVKIVTACENEAAITGKYRWLKKHFPMLKPAKDVITSYDKSLIRGSVIIDDKPDNLLTSVPNRILFDRPWNKNISDDMLEQLNNIGYVRLFNWKQIIDWFKYYDQH